MPHVPPAACRARAAVVAPWVPPMFRQHGGCKCNYPRPGCKCNNVAPMAAVAEALAYGNRNRAKRISELTLLSRAPWQDWRTRSQVARALRFMETYVIVPQGRGQGRPMKVRRFQRELLEQVLANEASVVSLPRGNGKSGLAV